MVLADSTSLCWDANSGSLHEISYRQLSWSIDDIGTLYGAILVERFRTYSQRVLDLDDRFERLVRGAATLQFNFPFSQHEFRTSIDRLMSLNSPTLLQEEDVGIVVLLSPGLAPIHSVAYGKQPTCMMHISCLPFIRLANWYREGTPLVLANRQIMPVNCCPTDIKTRSRIPYALAQLDDTSDDPNSLQVLRTVNGSLADTAVANIVVVSKDGTLHTPPSEDALDGVTLKCLKRILKSKGRSMVVRSIDVKELYLANEILLVGSTGGIWHARSIDGHRIGDGRIGPTGLELQSVWQQHVQCDFKKQALHRAGLV